MSRALSAVSILSLSLSGCSGSHSPSSFRISHEFLSVAVTRSLETTAPAAIIARTARELGIESEWRQRDEGKVDRAFSAFHFRIAASKQYSGVNELSVRHRRAQASGPYSELFVAEHTD